MTLQRFLSINGIMFIPFGLMMVFLPETLFSMLSFELNSEGLVMASTVGSMLFSFGTICWLVRKEEYSKTLQSVLIGNLLFHSLDSFLTGKAAITGTMNAAGFMFSSMHFMFAVGFAIFVYKSRVSSISAA